MMNLRHSSHPMFWSCLFLVMIFFGIVCPSESLGQKADADVLIGQAVLAYDEERYNDALGLLNQALELDPKEERGLYYKGLVHLSLQNPEEAVEPLERAHRFRPNDFHVQYHLGVAYFVLGKYDKAKPLFEAVYKQQPDLDNLNYYVGFLRYRDKEYEKAVETFKEVKSNDPNIQQLSNFYRGLALGTLGLSKEAINELEQIDDIGTVSPLTQSSVRIRQALAAREGVEEPKRLRLQVSLGGYYDDNVGVNPNSTAFIPGQQGPIVNQNTTNSALRRRQASAPGMLASVLANYSFLRRGPLEATATYSFFQTLNFNSLDSFNIQSHLVGLSGFYRGVLPKVNLPYQLSTQYTYDYVFLDSDAFLARHSPTFNAALVGPVVNLPLLGAMGNLTTVQYRFQTKTFFRETSNSNPAFASEGRDAFNNMLGFIHAFRFTSDKVILRAGYQYDNESTDGSAFAYEGNRFLTGGQVSLPWGAMTLRYDYDVHWREYKNAQILFTDRNGSLRDRYDRQQTHLVQLVKPLPNNFSLRFQYQGIRNKSRVPIYDYTKNVWTAIVTWTY